MDKKLSLLVLSSLILSTVILANISVARQNLVVLGTKSQLNAQVRQQPTVVDQKEAQEPNFFFSAWDKFLRFLGLRRDGPEETVRDFDYVGRGRPSESEPPPPAGVAEPPLPDSPGPPPLAEEEPPPPPILGVRYYPPEPPVLNTKSETVTGTVKNYFEEILDWIGS